ncbi:MAG: RIP metalloprotease RseP [Vulcanibacillus sp.]
MSIISTSLLVIEILIAFIAMLFVHELGHFVFAKRAGILVREFSIGMGPKIYSIKKGETKYSLRILPIGAYVSMAGEDVETYDVKIGQTIGIETDSQNIITNIYPKVDDNRKITIEELDLENKLFIKGLDDEGNFLDLLVSREATIHLEGKKIQIAPLDRQFGSKPITSRFLSIIGGPLFNIIFALVLFFTIALMIGAPSNQVTIGDITENSPAAEAGLQIGDKILGINNIVFDSSDKLVLMIQNSPEQEIELDIERDGMLLKVLIIPQDEDKDGIGLIGIKPVQVYQDVSIFQAVSMSFSETVKWIGLIFESFEMLFSGDVGLDDVAGPVGIVKITSDAAKAGIYTLMNWTAILSLYLGIFNLLPIPALDGSRLLFLTVEAIRRKPIDPKKESFIHFIGFAFLMLLMIFITVNDVTKLFN